MSRNEDFFGKRYTSAEEALAQLGISVDFIISEIDRTRDNPQLREEFRQRLTKFFAEVVAAPGVGILVIQANMPKKNS